MTVRELGAQLIPLEDDVLSLEQPCFKELFLDDERSVLYSVASGIMKLQAMFGTIPLVRGKGDRAQQVLATPHPHAHPHPNPHRHPNPHPSPNPSPNP